MNGFRNYLFSKGIANDENVSFYIMWVKKYLEFQKSSVRNDATNENIDHFIKGLSKNYLDWQIVQASEAVQAYFLFKEHNTSSPVPATGSTDQHWKLVAENRFLSPVPTYPKKEAGPSSDDPASCDRLHSVNNLFFCPITAYHFFANVEL